MKFEAIAIQVPPAAANVEQAHVLLKLNWSNVQRIMDRAMELGLFHRQLDHFKHVRMDEKSFVSGHDYVSVLTDIDGSRVLEVVPVNDEKSDDELRKTLSKELKDCIEAVAMDTWQAFENSALSNAPTQKLCMIDFIRRTFTLNPWTRFADWNTSRGKRTVTGHSTAQNSSGCTTL